MCDTVASLDPRHSSSCTASSLWEPCLYMGVLIRSTARSAPLLPDDEEAPVDWDWVAETALDIGGSFTFARDASPEQIMTAFGMNPAKARLVPASDVAQALH